MYVTLNSVKYSCQKGHLPKCSFAKIRDGDPDPSDKTPEPK
jgi:hypothetical protein